MHQGEGSVLKPLLLKLSLSSMCLQFPGLLQRSIIEFYGIIDSCFVMLYNFCHFFCRQNNGNSSQGKLAFRVVKNLLEIHGCKNLEHFNLNKKISISVPQVSFLFSDRGIPDGHRHMNGYGSHTFKLVNAKGEAVYCKFHYKVLLSGRRVQTPSPPPELFPSPLKTEQRLRILPPFSDFFVPQGTKN